VRSKPRPDGGEDYAQVVRGVMEPRDSDSLPNFLILGAQKSGTSSLARWLKRHPDVFIPPQKELHFFTKHVRDDDAYRAAFASVRQHAVGEATPDYLYDPNVPGAIQRLLGEDVRLVVVVRNPIDRAYSHYWHARRLGIVTGSFEAALADEDRVLGRAGASGWWSFVDRGRYVRQLERYERRFRRGQLHVELFDDLVSDSRAATERVWRFLDVDPAAAPPGMKFLPSNRASQTVLPPRLARQVMRLPVGSPARRWVTRRTTRSFTPPPMRHGTREQLRERLAPEIEALERWLGRDLPQWV
jgi:hypothetical protein